MHLREESPKLKRTLYIGDSPHRLLGKYLHGNESISKISYKVYAMEKTTAENIE